MVSFTCNHCQDVVKKPKVQSHANSCGAATFTCVDCMQVFNLDSIKAHTSCVTEEEKYQGKWKQKQGHASKGGRVGDAPRVGIERPPRAPMNDLSSSGSDSDDDWVTRGNKAATSRKSNSASAVDGPSKSTVAATHASRKHPRPGVDPSSSDEDKDGSGARVQEPGESGSKKCAGTAASAPAMKKTKNTHHASEPAGRSPATDARPKPDAALKGVAEKDDGGAGSPAHETTKNTPLLLPRSTASKECIVPSFVLGTSAEVADVVVEILHDGGVRSMRARDVARALVERYAKRIAKSVRHAVDTAAELGALKMDSEGNVSAV
ncbi:LYAR-type C2HC zinc finger containing protein [Novymonas esmeraldas]|uniref:LYAR-type C2HC zinc finger containing protein n=1 Tax=Novymonas esmeraldas TaxID=1808958 RepID=A0AAW0F0E6_9TRYP